jgi:hypothetical protein
MDNGKYLGISPTEESPCAYGEAEFTLNDETFSLRRATVQRIVTIMEGPRSDLIELMAGEISVHFRDGADIRGISGLRYGESGVILLLFPDVPGYEDTCRMLILGLPGAVAFGPSRFFTPDQIAAGSFDRFVANVDETIGPNAIPRLADEGRSVDSTPA